MSSHGVAPVLLSHLVRFSGRSLALADSRAGRPPENSTRNALTRLFYAPAGLISETNVFNLTHELRL
jgi:hypothetical protein